MGLPWTNILITMKKPKPLPFMANHVMTYAKNAAIRTLGVINSLSLPMGIGQEQTFAQMTQLEPHIEKTALMIVKKENMITFGAIREL